MFNNVNITKKKLISIYFVFCSLFLIFWILYNLDVNPLRRNIIFFFMLSLLIIFMEFPNNSKIISIIIFIAGLSISSYLYYPIASPDAIQYYRIVNQFDRLIDFLSYWFENMNSDPYVKFSIFYLPFYFFFHFKDEYFISVFNAFIDIFIVYLIYKITKNNFDYKLNSKSTFLTILVIGLFSSGNMIYHSTVFLKDVNVTFWCLLSLTLLLRKKYLLFIISLIISTYARIYSVVVIFCYYVIFKKKYKLAIIGLVCSLVFVFLNTGVTGLVNLNISVASLLISPHPFKINNWQLFGHRTLESLVIFLGLLLSLIVFLTQKESRKFYVLFLMSVYIYASIMVVAGSLWQSDLGIDYSVGIIGEDVARKKLPLIGLIYILFSYSLSMFLGKIQKGYKR